MLFITNIDGKNKEFESIMKNFMEEWRTTEREDALDCKLSETRETYVHYETYDDLKAECPYTDEDDICDYIHNESNRLTIRDAIKRLLIKFDINFISFLYVDEDAIGITSTYETLTISKDD